MRASDNPSLVVQRHLLGAELRKARRDAGQTQEQVAIAMGWSRSKVVRMEAGKVGVSTGDVYALLRHYRVVDLTHIDESMSLVKTIRRDKARSQIWEQGQTTIGPVSQLPESRRARAPESRLDFNDRLLADGDSVNRYKELQSHQIACQWQRIAQYLVFVAGNLALILVFWALVRLWKLPAEAAYLTIGCLISGYGGYALRMRLTAHEKRRPRDREDDESASF